MEANKSITDVINLTNNSSLLIPVKTETFLKLKQTDPLPASLFYLSKSYSANIWKSADSQNNHKIDESRCLRTDFQTSLFSTIELLYGYSVSGSIYTTKIDTCPHLLSNHLNLSKLNDDTLKFVYFCRPQRLLLHQRRNPTRL